MMQNKFLFAILIFLLSGCNQEEICINLPEGEYEAWFTDDRSKQTHHNQSLYLTIIDQNTISISRTEEVHYAATNIQRNSCRVKGIMQAMIGGRSQTLKIEGEIGRRSGDYVLEGIYSYTESPSGLGDPNRQYYEYTGRFEIISK